MLTKIQSWGNSQGLRIPKSILQDSDISVGDEVDISIQGGRIVVEPSNKVRGRYDLKKLVSKIPKNHKVKEEPWGKPLGKETW